MTSPREPLPYLDLAAQHRALRPEIDAAIARVIDASDFILGGEVQALETELAAYLGAAHAVGVSSGTDALYLALRALGIGPGDEVIVPAFTFLATAGAVRMAGARPVLADIDPLTFHLDPVSARARIGPGTRAVIPVHLYGQALDLEPFLALAREHGLRVIEDACQAHGARLPPGQDRAGTAGDAGCFSFYPSKNLGAMGEAGMVVTGDEATASRLRMLRSHGQARRYEHELLGFNHRLDGIQAAVLRVKLPHLEGWNERRRQLAERYHAALKGLPLTLPYPAPGRDHVYHCYVVRTARRDALHEWLAAEGIATAVHYPTAIHAQAPYRDLAEPGSLPHAEAAAREVLSLPLYPELDDERFERVVAAVRRYFAS